MANATGCHDSYQEVTGVTPEVNLREGTSYTSPQSVNKASHSGFKTQERCHQNSKTGVSVDHEKDRTE